MEKADFIVVGSSGGGGTISWLLAKAGFKVLVLEQGTDWGKPLDDDHLKYNPQPHDEYRFRLERPELKRRPRGDYNTFRKSSLDVAKPFSGGWTGSVLGGGSVIWGTWSFRALPRSETTMNGEFLFRFLFVPGSLECRSQSVVNLRISRGKALRAAQWWNCFFVFF